MHVLIAAHDYYPDPGSGGTGRYVTETARRLVDRGHLVSVITRRRGDVPKRETIEGIDLYRYDVSIAERGAPDILWQLPHASMTVSRHVNAVIRAAGMPDVVSYQGPVTSALLDRSIDDGIGRVATFHSPWPTEYRIKTRGPEGATGIRRQLNVALRRFLEGRVLSRSDRIVTLSEFMREELRRVYGDHLGAKIVPGGVDVDRFSPEGTSTDRLGGDPVFLTVRRLSERMGHERLLEAFATVVDEHPGARLYVAGDGPLRSHLERVAKANGVEEFTTFLGYVPDDALPSVYRAADVFVLPTISLEGFGLATLEALASGLPVVATPIGGSVEILSGLETQEEISEQLLVESTDVDALAEGMLDWARLAPAESATAARACRRYVEANYPWEQTVTRLEAVYENLSSGDDRRDSVSGTDRADTRSEPIET